MSLKKNSSSKSLLLLIISLLATYVMIEVIVEYKKYSAQKLYLNRTSDEYMAFGALAQGMRLAEAESIIGYPPGDYTDRVVNYRYLSTDLRVNNNETVVSWRTNKYHIFIVLNSNGVITSKGYGVSNE